MRAAQGALEAAGEREPVLQEETADGVESLGAELVALGAGGLGEDVEVDVGLVEAAALEGAQAAAFLGDTPVVNDEPGDPRSRVISDGSCRVSARSVDEAVASIWFDEESSVSAAISRAEVAIGSVPGSDCSGFELPASADYSLER